LPKGRTGGFLQRLPKGALVEPQTRRSGLPSGFNAFTRAGYHGSVFLCHD
jgi:hypothetical protein